MHRTKPQAGEASERGERSDVKRISHSTIIKLLGEFYTRIRENGITLVYENHILYNVTGFGNSEYYDCHYTEFVDDNDYWKFARNFVDLSVKRTTKNHEIKLITLTANKPNRIRCYEYTAKDWRRKLYLVTYYDIIVIGNDVNGAMFDNLGEACIFMACLAELRIV